MAIEFADYLPNEEPFVEMILDRAVDKFGFDRVETEMDLSCVHAREKLWLERLANADDYNFFHDMDGIRRHINRTTGQLDFFLPRFAVQGEEERIEYYVTVCGMTRGDAQAVVEAEDLG